MPRSSVERFAKYEQSERIERLLHVISLGFYIITRVDSRVNLLRVHGRVYTAKQFSGNMF